MDNFKINNRIDLGTDGIFLTGSEARLAKRLDEHEDGKKIFKDLKNRGAVSIVKATQAPVEDETAEAETAETQEPEAVEETESEDESEYEGTGKYEKHNYGGSMYAIADPDGKVIDRARGEESANDIVEELNNQS